MKGEVDEWDMGSSYFMSCVVELFGTGGAHDP